MSKHLRLGALLLALAAMVLLPSVVQASPSVETANLNESPATADPYTTDPAPASTDPDDPNYTVATSTIATTDNPDPAIKKGGYGGVAPTSTTAGCREITGKITAKNVFGDVQYTFEQVADWCWQGGKITFEHSEFHVSSPGQFWGYKNLVDSESTSGGTFWIRYREAYFAQCFPSALGGGCYHKSYPWVKMWMYSNGDYSMSHS
jgi:hypothetical protein